jgi:hypothetical protein
MILGFFSTHGLLSNAIRGAVQCIWENRASGKTDKKNKKAAGSVESACGL